MAYVKNKQGKVKYRNPNKPLEEGDKPYTSPADKPPIFTQQGTGKMNEGILYPESNTWETPASESEQIANKELIAEKQQQEVAKIKEENRIISPEEVALSEQQKIEQDQLAQMLQSPEQPTVQERNVQAGMAMVNAIQQTTIGGDVKDIQQQYDELTRAKGKVGSIPDKVALTVLGKVSTTKVAGFSLSDLFSKSNAGNIAELKGDADEITGRARLIYADASSRGGDTRQAIEQLRLSEEAVRQRYTDAQLALNASPADIAAGVDFTEDIYSNLVILQSYRQALERQQITGEKNLALASTPTTII